MLRYNLKREYTYREIYLINHVGTRLEIKSIMLCTIFSSLICYILRTFTIPMFWHKFLQLFRKPGTGCWKKLKSSPVSPTSRLSLTPPLTPPWNFISVPARGIVGASFIALYTPRYYFHRFTDFYIFELMNIKACGFNLFPVHPMETIFPVRKKKNILSSSRAIKLFFYETISKSEFSVNLTFIGID